MKFIKLNEIRVETMRTDGLPVKVRAHFRLNRDMIKLLVPLSDDRLPARTAIHIVGQIPPYFVEETGDEIEAMAETPLHVIVAKERGDF